MRDVLMVQLELADLVWDCAEEGRDIEESKKGRIKSQITIGMKKRSLYKNGVLVPGSPDPVTAERMA